MILLIFIIRIISYINNLKKPQKNDLDHIISAKSHKTRIYIKFTLFTIGYT
ncbi:hypothetical protein XBKB1_1920026 [Xenorhabdus bovienii str. kraussei Becker Underwood]|uniref:Uncharacterized protein n=1 Tax=Xenorhabdus bovienii str. kraussei Becker Underwood TaxID=1398204 RepID=A0A077PRM1_XENBV|nr:hypothetical protein XBKB1_1920026 [Xenorhabdus bovienii str. kraussei Becker Underwood]